MGYWDVGSRWLIVFWFDSWDILSFWQHETNYLTFLIPYFERPWKIGKDKVLQAAAKKSAHVTEHCSVKNWNSHAADSKSWEMWSSLQQSCNGDSWQQYLTKQFYKRLLQKGNCPTNCKKNDKMHCEMHIIQNAYYTKYKMQSAYHRKYKDHTKCKVHIIERTYCNIQTVIPNCNERVAANLAWCIHICFAICNRFYMCNCTLQNILGLCNHAIV